MDMWCGECGHIWEAETDTTHGVSCPKGCQNMGAGNGIYMDQTTVDLTEKGDGGAYGMDYEYAISSTYSVDENTGERTYEKAEFIPDGQIDGVRVENGVTGSWVSRGTRNNQIQ